jgi:hypothetical protein
MNREQVLLCHERLQILRMSPEVHTKQETQKHVVKGKNTNGLYICATRTAPYEGFFSAPYAQSLALVIDPHRIFLSCGRIGITAVRPGSAKHLDHEVENIADCS